MCQHSCVAFLRVHIDSTLIIAFRACIPPEILEFNWSIAESVNKQLTGELASWILKSYRSLDHFYHTIPLYRVKYNSVSHTVCFTRADLSQQLTPPLEKARENLRRLREPRRLAAHWLKT